MKEEMATTPVFLLAESQGQKSLIGYTVQEVTKSRTQLTGFSGTSFPRKKPLLQGRPDPELVLYCVEKR